MGARMLSAGWCVAAMLVCAGAPAQEVAGKALWVTGKVERVAPDGTVRALLQGDAVRRHDVVRTAAGSHAQLVMTDEALIAVRPESSLRIDEYRYAGAQHGGRAVFELMKGGFRSITGVIGRDDKSQYRLSTPTASIGIRGTDHETFVAEAGTYNRVTVGGTYLQSAHGRLEIGPGETGFAGSQANGAPFRLQRTPDFMQIASMRPGSTLVPVLREPAAVHPAREAPQAHPPRGPAQAIGDNAPTRPRGWERFGKIKKNKP
jgi:hypothetical protein